MVEVEVAQRPEGLVVVRLAGEIDLSQADAVRRAFDRVLAAGSAGVLIDLCDLRFLAVAGVDRIDAAVAEISRQGRAVAVVCTDRGPVARIVTLLGLDRRWPLHHDLALAMASVRDGTG
jgi:anti-sigma B factor antagonist